jgi:hypothetical protein
MGAVFRLPYGRLSLTLLDRKDRPTDADASAFLWVPRGFVGAAP